MKNMRLIFGAYFAEFDMRIFHAWRAVFIILTIAIQRGMRICMYSTNIYYAY